MGSIAVKRARLSERTVVLSVGGGGGHSRLSALARLSQRRPQRLSADYPDSCTRTEPGAGGYWCHKYAKSVDKASGRTTLQVDVTSRPQACNTTARMTPRKHLRVLSPGSRVPRPQEVRGGRHCRVQNVCFSLPPHVSLSALLCVPVRSCASREDKSEKHTGGRDPPPLHNVGVKP